jgi:hypothetical protein
MMRVDEDVPFNVDEVVSSAGRAGRASSRFV